MTPTELLLWTIGGFIVGYMVIRECRDDEKRARKEADRRKQERQRGRIDPRAVAARDLRTRQAILSAVMKQDGRHLLTGKSYTPVLTNGGRR